MPIVFVLINAEIGKEKSLLRELRSISDIKEAHFVYGAYDIIVKVEAESMEKLNEIITFRIKKTG